jgi:hypothetical protein
MQLSVLSLCLALAAPLVSAYPITGSSVNCRSGPGTSFKSVKTYSKGHSVKLSCQTYGESIFGNSIWDKTSDGCYVADYYVKTGTNSMVTGECDSAPGGGGSSKMNGKITRKEIISRGQYWISRHVPYSMSATYPDPHGTRYRTDCSGFVAMALHASAPGANTVSLPAIAKEIAWKDLKPGDFVGTLGPGTQNANGHVTLFLSWVDSSKKRYHTLECRGTSTGCVAFERPVGWKDGKFTSKPYKYIHVVED